MRTLSFFIYRRCFGSPEAFKTKHIVLQMRWHAHPTRWKALRRVFYQGVWIYWFEICGTISGRLDKSVEISKLSRVFFTSVET